MNCNALIQDVHESYPNYLDFNRNTENEFEVNKEKWVNGEKTSKVHQLTQFQLTNKNNKVKV